MDIYKSNKLLVLSAAPLIKNSERYSAYSPYCREMELWAKHADEIYFCCPVWNNDRGLLNAEINFKISGIYTLEEFSILNFREVISSFKSVFLNIFIIIKAFRNADHIHLRCPGNIGLLGCILQIFFPFKKKTAKYAGNWDPNSKQPISYKLQKFILSNTFLTRNMQVLVYGNWPNQTKNIKPFFTATYSESDIVDLPEKSLKSLIRFLFVGTLSEGKNPLYALKIVEILLNDGFDVRIDFYGEGAERIHLENYIRDKKLESKAQLHGNKAENIIREAYKISHFLILPSKSEGWPKAVAEAMFWNCLPIATAISCVSYILDDGNRGILISMQLEKDVDQIKNCILLENNYHLKVAKAMQWSRHFTVDLFEAEIQEILKA